MGNWTIIRILLSDGMYRFDALQTHTPLDTAVDIEFEDEYISAGTFEVVATGYTESQVDEFLAKVAQKAE